MLQCAGVCCDMLSPVVPCHAMLWSCCRQRKGVSECMTTRGVLSVLQGSRQPGQEKTSTLSSSHSLWRGNLKLAMLPMTLPMTPSKRRCFS